VVLNIAETIQIVSVIVIADVHKEIALVNVRAIANKYLDT